MTSTDHPAIGLVTEEPVTFGENTYTARLTPDEDPPRWTVFRDDQGTPVGYLEAVYDPRQSEDWQLLVWDGNMSPIGHHETRRKDTQAVHSYLNALSHIRGRLLDLG